MSGATVTCSYKPDGYLVDTHLERAMEATAQEWYVTDDIYPFRRIKIEFADEEMARCVANDLRIAFPGVLVRVVKHYPESA